MREDNQFVVENNFFPVTYKGKEYLAKVVSEWVSTQNHPMPFIKIFEKKTFMLFGLFLIPYKKFLTESPLDLERNYSFGLSKNNKRIFVIELLLLRAKEILALRFERIPIAS
mgnify:CR=1 FL=1